MNKKFEKSYDKCIFAVCLGISFLMILIYNAFTPYMTDDLSYKVVVDTANFLGDLFAQEYEHYLYHTGRNVAHMLMRIFMTQPKMVFNVCNSLAFTLLTWLLYANVDHKKKYDYRTLLLCTALVWLTGVKFAQTILWLDGSCNYMWGTVTILGFVTLYRHLLKRDVGGIVPSIAVAVGMFLFGILAGWYNENTSGGGLLLALACLIIYKWKDHGKLHPFMITGILGQLVGMVMMLSSPGTAARSALETGEEEHTGILALVARFQKIVINIEDLFFWLLVACLVMFILCIVQGRKLKEFLTAGILFFTFLATAFALILTAPPQQRAYFGAGMFLIILVGELFGLVREYPKMDEAQDELVADDVAAGNNVKESLEASGTATEGYILIRTLKTSAVAVMLFYLAFLYLENGANLMRIYRESMERFSYIEEQIANGYDTDDGITVAQLTPDFKCRYTCAYEMDLEEDPCYWINVAYEEYYNVGIIHAIPRDEWQELVGR